MCCDIMKKFWDMFGVVECGGKYGVYDGEKLFFISGSLFFNLKEFLVFLDDSKSILFCLGDCGGWNSNSLLINSLLIGMIEFLWIGLWGWVFNVIVCVGVFYFYFVIM